MIGDKNGARVRSQLLPGVLVRGCPPTTKGQVQRTDGFGNEHLNCGELEPVLVSKAPLDSGNSTATTPGADSWDIVPFISVIAAAVIVPLLLGGYAWFVGQ
jgi:hypothetical protein